MRKIFNNKIIFWPLVSGLTAGFVFLGVSLFTDNPAFNYSKINLEPAAAAEEEVYIPTHIATPDSVRAIYMTACVAATPSLREKLITLAKETEVNSIIIDIKDYTGTISFSSDNPKLEGVNGKGCAVSDMKELIERLHDNNIYVIGRITVFQDPYYAKLRPDLAIKKADKIGRAHV